MAAPSTPKTAQKEILERAQAGEKLPAAEVRRMIQEHKRPPGVPPPKPRTAEQRQAEIYAYSIASRAVLERVLLDLEMPNHKKLSQCTGADCKQFSKWFATLAREVPAHKTVGQVLKGSQLKKLWDEHD